MIPKKIHYIWLGHNQIPEIVQKCIDSWKKYCPDYEIIKHTEDDLNIDICQYCRQAYDNKKWAFASDVLRFSVLYNEGGIYLDTDVELIGNLDKFLENKLFFGFESKDFVGPGVIIGAEQHNEIVKDLLSEYNSRLFVKEDGSFDLTTICVYTTNKLQSLGLTLNDKTQFFNNFAVYSTEYFCPKNTRGKMVNKTKNTCAIHHFASSWKPKKTFFQRVCGRLKRFFAEKSKSK